jgi:type IV pilus assembly protein PilV
MYLLMSRTPRHAQGGAALLEALVAMLIVAFGVLGFVGLQARTAVLNLEGYQRAQALMLVNDMAQRIYTNRTAAASYVTTSAGYPGATTPASDCSSLSTRADQDVCEWSKLLLSAGESQTATVTSVNSARGCVQSIGTNQYVVAVFWEGIQASGASPVACGWAGTTAPTYSSDTLRRAVSMVVQIGILS